MALAITATDTDLQKPVNVIFRQELLRRARQRAPYFAGTQAGALQIHGGTATIKWRRINNLTPTTTALTELTGNATFGMGRDAEVAGATDITATVSKFGQFYYLNEEVDMFNFNGQASELVGTLAHSAGRSLNMLQRDVADDNLTEVFTNGDSDGAVNTKITAATLRTVINTLNRNSAMTFMPMSTGSTATGTVPILPAFWGICHPDIAEDLAQLTGFVSVEKYAGQVDTAQFEFGLFAGAGMAVRFIQTEDANIDAGAGATGGTSVRETTNDADLYSTVIYGEHALGSVGLGQQHTDGIYRAGDALDAVDLIVKDFGSGGTADPFNEVMSMAWKAWHAGAVLNADWGRVIRSAAGAL